MRFLAHVIAALAVLGDSVSAFSQNFPTRPISLVLGAAPGGSSARVCRHVPSQKIYLIVCGVSNWGGYALPAALALQRPDLRIALTAKLNREADLAILKAAVFEGGAVQGTTGTGILSVDKLPWEVHADLLAEVVNVIEEVNGQDNLIGCNL